MFFFDGIEDCTGCLKDKPIFYLAGHIRTPRLNAFLFEPKRVVRIDIQVKPDDEINAFGCIVYNCRRK